MINVFGGGFVQGSRTGETNVRFFKKMVALGYAVAAIDYRLGLKGVKLGLFHLKQLDITIKDKELLEKYK